MSDPLPADVLSLAEAAVQKWARTSQEMDPVATYDGLVDLIGGAILDDRDMRDLNALAGLTLPQAQILTFIRSYTAANQISPTLDEIVHTTKRSKSHVHHSLQELQRKGRITREKFRARSIVLLQPRANQ
ncbi:MAG TPA: hypothetical protein VL147_01635 [Devosia sp.]|nr:hypothetical protein [Devosia sp.]